MPSVSGQMKVVVIASVVGEVLPVDSCDVLGTGDSVDDALNVVDGGDENEVLIIFEVSPDVTEAFVTPVLVELIVSVDVVPLTVGGTVLLVITVVAVAGV
jgi:hypothetical protein